jgi:hypothetical protein
MNNAFRKKNQYSKIEHPAILILFFTLKDPED